GVPAPTARLGVAVAAHGGFDGKGADVDIAGRRSRFDRPLIGGIIESILQCFQIDGRRTLWRHRLLLRLVTMPLRTCSGRVHHGSSMSYSRSLKCRRPVTARF